MTILDRIQIERGMVARIYSDFNDFPMSVEAHFFMNKVLILDDGPLKRVEREFLAYETSRLNNNNYCSSHHKVALENSALENDFSSTRFQCLKKLAEVLTLEPHNAVSLQNEFLLNGFTTAEWQHSVNIVSYFNYTNRLAFAMGIELEAGYERSCN